jgi:hypothetical protein
LKNKKGKKMKIEFSVSELQILAECLFYSEVLENWYCSELEKNILLKKIELEIEKETL